MIKKSLLFFLLFLQIYFCLANPLIEKTVYIAKLDSIKVQKIKIEGNVYMLYCINGFAGGNVVASVGKDGVLLVDDMFVSMSKQITQTLAEIDEKPIKIILNTHYHGDHIQGNFNFKSSAVIIGHENITKRLVLNSTEANKNSSLIPAITFSDSIIVNFNDEKVQMIHYPNSHTDGDAIIYFPKSKTLHLGDLFFNGMFPAVYAKDGGNIKQLVENLKSILKKFPSDTHVIPGHGGLATMKDLSDYISMLKETISIVEQNIKKGVSLVQMQNDDVLKKYNSLGSGGAQTTDQYIEMLFKLLK